MNNVDGSVVLDDIPVFWTLPTYAYEILDQVCQSSLMSPRVYFKIPGCDLCHISAIPQILNASRQTGHIDSQTDPAHVSTIGKTESPNKQLFESRHGRLFCPNAAPWGHPCRPDNHLQDVGEKVQARLRDQ